MARPSRVNDPIQVGIGSLWVPRYANLAAVKVLACVDRPNGTNFVVKSLEDGRINRTRLLSYKYLLANYVLSEQASVH